MSRNIPRNIPRNSPRNIPQKIPLNIPRKMPRNIPRNIPRNHTYNPRPQNTRMCSACDFRQNYMIPQNQNARLSHNQNVANPNRSQ